MVCVSALWNGHMLCMQAKGTTMERSIDARPTLRAWLDEYASIEDDYVEAFRSRGVDFAERGADAREVARLKRNLRARGVRFRNGDASICRGALSSACVACTGDCGSKTFFLSLACNRRCYFCFNSNQSGFEQLKTLNAAWRDEVDAYFASVGGPENVTHVGLTGGEPLLYADEAVAFVRYVNDVAPQAHIRLYTAGDFLTEGLLERLRDVGLSELRLSVKLDVDDNAQEARRVVDEAVSRIGLVTRYIAQAMVEMPAIPGTDDAMRRLLVGLDEAGAFGVNLLEFGYPLNGWKPFAQRGFQVENPPFPVTYNWEYAGGLPIAGSEELCLRLMRFADEAGLRMGVHYCSLENKNRDQVISQNRAFVPDARVYEQDANTFYYVTLKFFDGDIAVARAGLARTGLSDRAIRQDDCLLVHPSCAAALAGEPVVPARSLNVVERRNGQLALREVKLECRENDAMDASRDWMTWATAWEFAAFSFRYPTPAHVDALESGQWAAAADEIMEALDVSVPEGFAWAARDAAEQAHGGGVLDALRTESTRLLIGTPHAVCSPYEGQWRQAGDFRTPLFVNKYSLEVERFCKECGFARPEGTNEPLDHVATECELLERLALSAAGCAGDGGDASGDDPDGGLVEVSAEAAAQLYERFVAEHASAWMPQFAAEVKEASGLAFFQAAACYLEALLCAEAAVSRES